MKAKDARALSNKSLATVVIGPILEKVHQKIKAQASSGKTELRDPFDDILPSPSIDTRAAVADRLRADGFKVQDMPEEDPGHYASRPYILITW